MYDVMYFILISIIIISSSCLFFSFFFYRPSNFILFLMTHQMMGGRKIRVDIAGGEGGNQRRGFSDRGGNRDRDDDRLERSEGVSDWRAAPRDSLPRDGECLFFSVL